MGGGSVDWPGSGGGEDEAVGEEGRGEVIAGSEDPEMKSSSSSSSEEEIVCVIGAEWRLLMVEAFDLEVVVGGLPFGRCGLNAVDALRFVVVVDVGGILSQCVSLGVL